MGHRQRDVGGRVCPTKPVKDPKLEKMILRIYRDLIDHYRPLMQGPKGAFHRKRLIEHFVQLTYFIQASRGGE